MAPRVRRTVDRMAQYKKDAAAAKLQGRGRAPRSRTSPRSKKSKRLQVGNPGTDSSPLGDARNENNNNSAALVSAHQDSSFEHPGTSHCQSPVVDSNMKSRNGMSLEDLAEIPETPPREVIVSGHKRVHPLLFQGSERDGGEMDAISLGEESQKPSKKSKTFQTPPPAATLSIREGVSNRSPVGEFDIEGSVRRNLALVPGNMDIQDDFEKLSPPPCKGAGPTMHRSCTRRSGRENLIRSRLRMEGADRLTPIDISAEPPDTLETIATSTATLYRIFDSLHGKICSDMERVREQCLAEVSKVSTSLSSKIFSELRNIHGMLDMMSKSGGRGEVVGKGGKKTPLTKWEEKLNELTSGVGIILSTEAFAKIVSYNAPLKAVEVYTSGTSTDVNNASQAYQTLLFSLRPRDKKNEYREGIRKLHGDFKYAVVQNAFYNLFKDSFRMFFPTTTGVRNVEEQDRADDDRGANLMGLNAISTEDKVRIARPAWLRPGFVAVDHFRWAREFLENANQSRKDKVRSTPTPSDIACHGVLRVYRRLGSHLHDARDYVRTRFFLGLGYLLVSWSDHVSENDCKKQSLTFPTVDSEQEFSLNMAVIPLTKTCSSTADAKTKNAVDAANKELLKQLFAHWEGMILTVRHDVYVLKGNGGQRRFSGGEKKEICRLIISSMWLLTFAWSTPA